ncbi:TetR/AcrR family transcriptional regulator [Streptomyces lomondensis]|uniref:TetR family transcriptional regulator n=1 Tax=Streptomyces lomondensis TaxID=68229 RepID=A0ABQ2XK29_9ACTN|nr:TetR/AcrR family transcriptional regulator [Streptomyces lomondensis]MCF0079697.1 TetR/AcrR family transcriptional regulator [Streptomyces lomondensis]GGX19893.1 TetR family transcriptional regulator [Streptomyces lomondensis]
MVHDEGPGADDDGRHGRLSRERVLATALDLVDREGLAALTMRRVGAELGVEAMSLYRYAPGKNALLDGVVEALFRQLEDRLARAPAPEAAARAGTPEWRAELHRIALVTYQVCLDHPEGAPLIITRMTEVPLARRAPAVLRDQERVLGALWEAGLDDARAASVLRAFTAWVLGYVSVELRAMVDNPDEPDPAFRLGLYRMPFRELPRLRATAPALAERGGPEGLAAGLDALLDRFVDLRE